MISAIQPKAANAPPVAPAREENAPSRPQASEQTIERPVVAPPPKPEIKLDTEAMRRNLQEAIDHINNLMRDGGRNLKFAVDETLNRPIVQVKKVDSGEVIRQIPSEVVVRIAHSIEDLKGMLLNASV
jgi:flagellar protein FlaG